MAKNQVLIFENDAVPSEMIVLVLNELGIDVVIGNKYSIVDDSLRNKPDLIIFDDWLLRGKECETYYLLTAGAVADPIPVVLTTTSSYSEEEAKALGAVISSNFS